MKWTLKLTVLHLFFILICALLLFCCLGPIVEKFDTATYQKNLETETGIFNGQYIINGKPSTVQELGDYYKKLYGNNFNLPNWLNQQEQHPPVSIKTNYPVPSQINNEQNMNNERTYASWNAGFDSGIKEGEIIGSAKQKERNIIFGNS